MTTIAFRVSFEIDMISQSEMEGENSRQPFSAAWAESAGGRRDLFNADDD